MRPSGILLVEDDPTDVEVACRAFRRADVEDVRVARDGEEALAALRLDGAAAEAAPVRCPKVVFLDLKMPKLNGLEVLSRIRAAEHTRDIPVVVVSSSSRPEDVEAAYRLGANSFLVKRFREGRPGGFLEDAARYWLDLNRAPGPGRR